MRKIREQTTDHESSDDSDPYVTDGSDDSENQLSELDKRNDFVGFEDQEGIISPEENESSDEGG